MNPFLTLLYPFQVTEIGLVTDILGNEICFIFTKPLRTRELNLVKESSIIQIDIQKKPINMLNKEIHFKE